MTTTAPSLHQLAKALKKAYPGATEPYSEIALAILTGNVDDEARNATWDNEDGYVIDYGDGPCDAYTRVGETPAGVFLVDDGDDMERDVQPKAYWSREDAAKAAQELAASQDESNAGEDAADVRRRQLRETAGEANPEGLWACYWHTVSDDARPVERYDSAEQAEAAAELKQDELEARNPGGGLLCGFEARYFEDGEWVRRDEEHY